MKHFLSVIFIIIICNGCINTNNKLSVVSIDCGDILRHQSALQNDSICHLFSRINSDIVEVRGVLSFNEISKITDQNKYKIICTDSIYNEVFTINTFLLIKNKVVSLLTSSTQFENSDSLNSNKIISWYKFKYLKTGYIFYLFKLNIHNGINGFKSKELSYNLLNKVNNVSSGAPVILMSHYNGDYSNISNILTNKWVGHYSFYKAPNSNNESLKFFTNDFFKVKSIKEKVNGIVFISDIDIKFSQKTRVIKKNSDGDILPEY